MFLQEQLKPYESYIPGIVRNLSAIVELLKTPSNLNAILERLKSIKNKIEPYKSMAPMRVGPLLKLLDEVEKDLSQ